MRQKCYHQALGITVIVVFMLVMLFQVPDVSIPPVSEELPENTTFLGLDQDGDPQYQTKIKRESVSKASSSMSMLSASYKWVWGDGGDGWVSGF